MAVSIDGPVGLRFHRQNVKNNAEDQRKVVKLLAAIPKSQGGKKEEWGTPPLAGPDGTCPKLLVDAIWDFQVFWKKQGLFHNIDAVVDPNMNTLKQLNKLASGGSVDPPNPPNDPTTKAQDIILRFTGAPNGNGPDGAREQALSREFNTAGYLATHKPLKAICFQGFREQEQFVDGAVAEVARLRGETSQGVTIVLGSSAGGVSALKAAVKLTEKNIRLAYVGINDAAFLSSKGEVLFKPSFAINLKAVTGGKAIDPDALKENFFQTAGHEWQFDRKHPTGFAFYAEFHGPLDGFVNNDLRDKPKVLAVISSYNAAAFAASPNDLPVAARDHFAASVHRAAGGAAEAPIGARVKGLIKP
jgi:pimeloyl-ACP methyl ester carboxylesterase